MSDNPGKNPYRPGAAVRPLFLAGRDRELARFSSVLAAAPELPANVRLSGLRGVGKTVLLKEFETRAEDQGWIVTREQIEPRHNREDELTGLVVGLADQAKRKASRAQRLRQAVADATSAVTRILKISYEDIEISIDPAGGARQRDLVRALFEAAETAYRGGFHGYLLMLDEAQILRDEKNRNGEHPLSLLIAAVNTLQEREVPVGLVVCGLPTLRTNLLRARTYTERMFRGEEIGQLPDPEARDAFVRPLDNTGVQADDDLVERVVAEVEGYPYFVQIWGAELWEAASAAGTRQFNAALLDVVESDIYRRLDSDFYDGRVESLTPAEQDLLMSTTSCPYPPLRTADIQAQSNKRQGNINVLMGRLSDEGVLYRKQKGIYDYTAPKFHDYLVRRLSKLGGGG